MHSWFGLINQVSYAFSAMVMLPFCQSLKPGTMSSTHYLKRPSLSSSVTLKRIFKSLTKTNLPCHWLVQNWPPTLPFCCHTDWKITLVGSRFTNPAESCYAPIKGEALAMADSLDKALFFVLCCENHSLLWTINHYLKSLVISPWIKLPTANSAALKKPTMIQVQTNPWHSTGPGTCYWHLIPWNLDNIATLTTLHDNSTWALLLTGIRLHEIPLDSSTFNLEEALVWSATNNLGSLAEPHQSRHNLCKQLSSAHI